MALFEFKAKTSAEVNSRIRTGVRILDDRNVTTGTISTVLDYGIIGLISGSSSSLLQLPLSNLI